MKSLSVLTILTFLTFARVSYAQTSTPATDPTQQPAETDTEKGTDFNYPQSPVRLPNSPSEDTLIKATKPNAIIHDALVPTADNKNDIDRLKRRGRKKDASQIDTASNKSNKISIPR